MLASRVEIHIAKSRQYKEEIRILRMRISEKEKQIADSKLKMDRDLRKAQKIILFTSSLWDRYSRLRKEELNPKWEELRKLRQERIRKLKCDSSNNLIPR